MPFVSSHYPASTCAALSNSEPVSNFVRGFSKYRLPRSSLSLSRQTGNDPSVTGLLRVFKDYYPEIIVGEATRAKASAFKV